MKVFDQLDLAVKQKGLYSVYVNPSNGQFSSQVYFRPKQDVNNCSMLHWEHWETAFMSIC